jgi:hypothetical protein
MIYLMTKSVRIDSMPLPPCSRFWWMLRQTSGHTKARAAPMINTATACCRSADELPWSWRKIRIQFNLKARLTIIWIQISQTQLDYTTIYNVFSSGCQSIEVDVSWCLLIDVELGLGATEWPLCSEGGLAARNVPCRELQAPRIAPLSSKWWKHELHGTSCNPLWKVTG